MAERCWEVVGGADKGGIVVRESRVLSSPMVEARLATGSVVEELELVGERLRYKMLSGTGPVEGWVSTKINGKELLVLQKTKFDPYKILGVPSDATDAVIKSAYRKASLKVHPDRCPDDPDAASKFQELTRAKDFLLSPLKRMMYNARHGLLKQQSAQVIWWTDWDTIFGEIEAAADDELFESAAQSTLERPLGAPEIDFLIVGATSLTGIMACMLLQKHRWPRSWAIAGRNGRKLELLESKFGGSPLYRGAMRVETPESIQAAVSKARVIVDFTGPSHLVGSTVAEACVEYGKHYVDSTGDVVFSKMVKDQLDEKAKTAGSCLIFHTGYCSMPNDFGTWYLVKYIRDTYKKPTRWVRAYDRTTSFFLGGTNYVQGFTFGGETEKHLDPFYLGGVPKKGVRDEDKAPNEGVRDDVTGLWAITAAITDRMVVRSSCGFLDSSTPYGANFNFSNWVPFTDRASATQAIMATAFVSRKLVSKLAEKKSIPAMGEGPGERLRQETYVNRILVGQADESGSNPRIAHVKMNAGPGGFGDRYEGTAAMSLEAACALLDAEDSGKSDSLTPGWGTPVSHLAHLDFWDRLVALGFDLKVSDGSPPQAFWNNLLSETLAIGS